MSQNEQIIRGCVNCPYLRYDDETNDLYCDYPDLKLNELPNLNEFSLTEGLAPQIAPPDCPLRRASVLVRLGS